LKISRMKTNHRKNPIGCQLSNPSVSWVVTDAVGKHEEAVRVWVAKDKNFSDVIYDSGKTKRNGTMFPLPIELTPRTRYYWKVRVWDETGDTAESEIAWFETGKMQEKWSAKWITPDWESEECHPIMKKSFTLSEKPLRARVYATGVGLYELYINGAKVGDEVLQPGYNAYDKWIQVQTYDITDNLKVGDNTIEVLLGNGWYKGEFSPHDRIAIYGNQFAVLAEVHIDLVNGEHILINTDESWTAHPSVIRSSGIYEGETQDYSVDLSKVWPVKIIDIGYNNLSDRLSPPLRIQEERLPQKLLHTPAGETVLDMGQNMVGWLRCKLLIPKGHEVLLQFGEILQHGNFYNGNLEKAKQEFRLIGDGIERVYEPHFTFYGFRYVKISGINVENINDFVGCVIHSDMERIGFIETSNNSINQLFQNALWGQKGNFLDTPTDCPQRSERLGWTGDAQVFCGTALFNMDCSAFYEKYLHDLWLEQKNNDGLVPQVIPVLKSWEHPFGNHLMMGSAGWSDAATIIPWQVYLHTGDPAILAKQYESMKAWVDYIRRQDDGSFLWKTGFHFGDWLSQDTRDPNETFGGTPKYYIASCFYALSSELTGKAAKVLGYTKDAEFYLELSKKIKDAIKKEFISPNGRVGVDSQTASVLALRFEVIEPKFRSRVVRELVDKVISAGGHLTTGFIGTPYLLFALSENGENETAYSILLKRDFPSWLYAVDLGATTIWERWNSVLPDGTINPVGMNSLNHYAFGSVVEWMYREMCGINPVEDAPGFKKIRISPKPCYMIKWAKAEVNTISGKCVCSWEIEKEALKIHVEVPFDTTATLILPEGCTVNGQTELELEAGIYDFSIVPAKKYYVTFGIDTPVRVLLDHPKAREVLRKYLPILVQYSSLIATEYREKSLKTLISTTPGFSLSEEAFAKLEEGLAAIKPWDL